MTEHEPMGHEPSFEELIDRASDETNRGAQPSTPSSASKLLGTIRGVLDSLRTAGTPDERLIERAATMPSTLIERLGLDKVGVGLANLVGDTRGAVLAGYRGAATTYALTFETAGVEIHLEVTPPNDDGGSAEINAHVDAGDGDIAGTVHFRKTLDAHELATADLDDGGYVNVTLPLGTYDLLIELKDRSVVVPAVEIG